MNNNNILDIIDRDFTLLLDNLPVGIIRLNSNKNCIYVNRFIYDLFEITPNQQDNQYTILYEIFRRIHPEDLPTFQSEDEQFLLDHKENESVFKIWRESIHDWVWVSNKKILIHNCDDNNKDNNNNKDNISYMYTFQDINKTKTMEIQLRDQQLRLEQAYNHKSIFLANFSHELRSPIHGVMGMLTLLEDTPLTQEQTDYINMIKECSFNLMTIISDILDYSKLEIGKITLDNKPMNLRSECIEPVNDMIISRIVEKGIEYTYNIENDVNPCIIGDPVRLKQIILNLVSNSVKFTDSGNIFINVKKIPHIDYLLLKRHLDYQITEENEKYNDNANNNNDNTNNNNHNDYTIYLRFDITDTGCGIDISQQNKLFKSFSQVDNNNKSKVYGGTGLGLAICKELVELMGGYIWLDWSENRTGSRFSFVIKTKTAICEDHQQQQVSLSEESNNSQSFLNINILILDENVHNRIALTSMVNSWGMRAYCFSNVEEALYFTKITDFDIGLVDICLPDIHSFTPDFPTVGLINFGDKPSPDNIFVSYLTKPVKESKLKQTIKKNINSFNLSDDIKLNSSKNLENEKAKYYVPIVNQVLGEHLKSTTKILLAEDVHVNQKVICSFLRKLGFINIEIAQNGVECLEIMKNHEFDIVLLDIRMPLLNGDAVLTQIVEYYNNYNYNKNNSINTGKFKNKKQPYTIAVTAYCLKDDKEKYLNMGFDDYLPKPIDINALQNCLNKCINKMLLSSD